MMDYSGDGKRPLEDEGKTLQDYRGIAELFIEHGEALESDILRSRLSQEELYLVLSFGQIGIAYQLPEVVIEARHTLLGSAAVDGMARLETLYASRPHTPPHLAEMVERRSRWGRMFSFLGRRRSEAQPTQRELR